MPEPTSPMPDQMYPKTHAKDLYCLTEKDLEPLVPKEKTNPYVRKGTPMKLYKQRDLEEAATQKWGSLEALEEEKKKRVEKKEKRALHKAKDADKDEEQLEIERGEDHQQSTSQPLVQGGELHPLIKERVKVLHNPKGEPSGDYVLYWMHTAVRDAENPALDVALHEASSRKLPLIVASYLLGSHTYPTHRRYKFLLEGLQDVQISLKSKGIKHLVFVEGISCNKNGQAAEGWEAVMETVHQAALVIMEIMPTPPYCNWQKDLVKQAPENTAVLAVETSCIVPVTLSKKAYAKAYNFRSVTGNQRKERLQDLPYPNQLNIDLDAGACERAAERIPWTSVDLEDANLDITELLKRSPAFDSSVPGVNHMPGGQKAGYARWESFKKNGLSEYAARRNNAMLRMSAYHHFGMVSPFRIARDTSNGGTNGARKFADEFLTWRELAYCFCFHNTDILETFQVLPTWSQKTLTAHRGDKRDIKTIQQLEEGNTGDEIWDALQYQLNHTGELHNNVRMTWGKALLPWTKDPETALKQTIHLNHKYAMDGCDPSSYGGILWCYGQFDGPKGAESTPIFGSLRNRPTHWLTRKITASRFRSLPVDEDQAAAKGSTAGGNAATPGGKDIRNLFQQAGHQGEDATGAGSTAEGEAAAIGSGDVAPPQGNSPVKASTGKKRIAKGQPGIESFFKRSK